MGEGSPVMHTRDTSLTTVLLILVVIYSLIAIGCRGVRKHLVLYCVNSALLAIYVTTVGEWEIRQSQGGGRSREINITAFSQTLCC